MDKRTVIEVCKAVRDARGMALADRVVWAAACDGAVSLKIADGEMTRPDLESLLKSIEAAIRQDSRLAHEPLTSLVIDAVDHQGDVRGTVSLTGQGSVSSTKAPAATIEAADRPVARNVIAVGAGKGGVGKSTVAVNLAVGLARRGHAVGLLDGDIYGPSLPTMLGLGSLEQAVIAGQLQPFLVHGVRAVTMGKLVAPDQPMIWRGPMAHRAFKQLVEQTDWSYPDYLVIDLPPGTGDVVLTMAQVLRLTGAVVVCTPQKVAQDDASRAIGMFRQLNVPVLGVVENMSGFIADDGKSYDIFGKGGAATLAQRLGVPFLGTIPISMTIRQTGDSGIPTDNFAPGPLADALNELVDATLKQSALASMTAQTATPRLTIN